MICGAGFCLLAGLIVASAWMMKGTGQTEGDGDETLPAWHLLITMFKVAVHSTQGPRLYRKSSKKR